MEKSLNRTQMAGLILIGLSLVTFIAGGTLVSSWLAAVEPSGIHIYVKDAETNQHLPKDIVTVTLTGFSYFGVDYPIYVELRSSRTTPTYWSFSSSLYTLYYVSISATGYVTQTGKVGMPQNFIAEYTYKLSPQPPLPAPGEDPVPDPEPLPPDEPEPVEMEAEVYVNGIRVMQGETVTVDTLDLSFRVVVTSGGFQQIWGYVDEAKITFEVSDDWGEATASYRLPGDGEYEVTIRVLDKGGSERPLASFAAVLGSGGSTGDTPGPGAGSVDEAVAEALGRTTTLLSAALACMGVGVYMLGSLKEERRR